MVYLAEKPKPVPPPMPPTDKPGGKGGRRFSMQMPAGDKPPKPMPPSDRPGRDRPTPPNEQWTPPDPDPRDRQERMPPGDRPGRPPVRKDTRQAASRVQ